jgi:site-specific recombinase XerD
VDDHLWTTTQSCVFVVQLNWAICDWVFYMANRQELILASNEPRYDDSTLAEFRKELYRVTSGNLEPRYLHGAPLWLSDFTERIDGIFDELESVEYGSIRYLELKAFNQNTLKSYKSDLKTIDEILGGVTTLPFTVDLVKNYIQKCFVAGHAPTTVNRRIVALSWAHRAAGLPDPTLDGMVQNMLRSVRKDRVENNWQPDRVPPLTLKQIIKMIGASQGDDIRSIRDRALILVGFFGAYRESELANITFESIYSSDLGFAIRMGVSKTDQTGSKGHYKAIPKLPKAQARYCPYRALEHWMNQIGLHEGLVFRGFTTIQRKVNGKKISELKIGGFKKDKCTHEVKPVKLSHYSINQAIKSMAKRAGLKQANKYAGHSLRSGFVTQLRGSVEDAMIIRQTGHTNTAILKYYDRPEDAFDKTPVKELSRQLRRITEKNEYP